MYDLPRHRERDHAVILDFVREHPFAMLIGSSNEGPVATQVPILIDVREGGQLVLRGHMMRGMDHHKAFQEKSEALCVFYGAHTYVSARWYSNPQTGSTFSYMHVHARGEIRFLDESALRRILEETTAHFENDENSPSLFRHLPKTYVDAMAKMIVGFEIEVRELKNVFKLSQDRDEPSYENIMRELDKQGSDARTIAQEMRKRKAQLFGQGPQSPSSSPSKSS